ncbi:hypothetical protein HKCCE3408_13840 [Rhodobacterales bacterium HKCCE3408]|nr:hypothetical protein [Rhodobacterales bacterium HKCCE3408]
MADPPHIARRSVFFLPGFDPAAARSFRERYRREGARQAAISGYGLQVAGEGGTPRWRATGTFDGQKTEARIEVLVWSDIVRETMRGGPWATYAGLARTAWVYLSSGALVRLARLRKGPVIAVLYPVTVLLLQLVAALLAGWLFGRAAQAATGSAWALVLGVPVVLWLPGLFARFDGRLLAHYLMQDYAFAASRNGAYPEELDARLADFTDRIAAAFDEAPDEVLVVGHSSGAYLAVSVVADLLRSGRVPDGARLSLLTLGQVVPMVSFLPGATRLRRDLAELSVSDRLTWVDVSAPGDGCAFALCDPVAVTGLATPERRWPLVLSAAFSRTLSPEAWARLRWRFFAAHFQYLDAFDRPGDYDYFAITAGPLSLGDRFAGRAPSRSRIETPLSRHTSVAA